MSGRLAAGHDLLKTLDTKGSRGGHPRPIINPATGTPFATVIDASLSDVNAAVEAAQRAAREWGRSTPAERAAALLNLATLLEAQAEAVGQLESLNTGKPIGMATDEVAQAADLIRFFAGAARTAVGPAPGNYTGSHLSALVREPIGVVAGIVPWNYPLLMAIWKIAPALAAGNTIVVKPAELTPLSLLAFAGLVARALPEGVLQVLPGSGDVVGSALARHRGIGMISLTGSVRAGRAVSAAAAESLKQVHLELGGKAPVIVFDDADLERMAETVALMGTWNAGQECGAATRVIAHQSVSAAVTEALVAASANFTVGDPAVDDADFGPLISEHHLGRVAAMVGGAAAAGASVRLGGSATGEGGFFFPATVLDGIARGSEIDQVEIFGPVITVQEFTDEDVAIEIANDTEYGLSASVWTRDGARGLAVSEQLDAGTVWINDHLAIAPEMPWGGFKSSGHGRDLSTLGLDEYSRTKHVMVNLQR